MNAPALPAQRAQRLTDEEIIRAAEALLRETQALPSDRDVLGRLRRGSLTTVNRTMRAWRAQAAGKLLDRAAPELPDEIATLVRGLWGAALDAARAQAGSELAAQRAELDRDRAAFSVEAGELRQRAAGLQVAYDLERSANTGHAEEIRRLRERIEALTGSVADAEARVRSAETDALLERQAREKAETREAQRAQERDEAAQMAAQRERTLSERHEAEVRLHVQRTEDQRARAERAEAAAAKAAQRAEQREAALEAAAQSRIAESGRQASLRLDAAESQIVALRASLEAERRKLEQVSAEVSHWKALAEERGAALKRPASRRSKTAGDGIENPGTLR